jgi:hypothetical protein
VLVEEGEAGVVPVKTGALGRAETTWVMFVVSSGLQAARNARNVPASR